MFSEQENRHLGEEIDRAGGECLRDMRVRPGGSRIAARGARRADGRHHAAGAVLARKASDRNAGGRAGRLLRSVLVWNPGAWAP